MNMLIGVLCEVVSVTAAVEKEEMMMQDLKIRLSSFMDAAGSQNDTISIERFFHLMDSPADVQTLHEIGIDIAALVDFADFIFKGKDELEMGEFMENIMQFRGSNHATVKDIVDTRVFVTAELDELRRSLKLSGRIIPPD